jgi:hypothetical protein
MSGLETVSIEVNFHNHDERIKNNNLLFRYQK